MAERLECRNISRNSLHRVLQKQALGGSTGVDRRVTPELSDPTASSYVHLARGRRLRLQRLARTSSDALKACISASGRFLAGSERRLRSPRPSPPGSASHSGACKASDPADEELGSG